MDAIAFSPVPILEEWADMDGPRLGGILRAEEQAVYRAFPTPKRRRDWLAGRVAAKRLLSRKLAELGEGWPESRIHIFNLPSGQPDWSVEGETSLPHWPISISHSSILAACALNALEGAVGMDIERIEKRHPAWLGIAFHPAELTADLREDPALQTRLWTTKEAVLKLLGLGLKADLWEVRCGIAGVPEARLHGLAQRQHRRMGSPRIHLSTWDLSESVATVAYTTQRLPGGIHGSLA